jgi:fructosamine-3-kinase
VNVQEELLEANIDPYLTDEALGSVISRALDRTSDVSGYRVLTGGCWNRVIGVALPDSASGETGDPKEIVCKISPNLHDSRLKREHEVLGYFESATDMPVPRPLLLDDSGDQIPGTVLVMTMIPGTVLHESYGYLDASGREAVSRQIAEHVTDLHRTRVTGFGGVEVAAKDRIADWSEFWLPRFDSVLEEVKDGDFISEKMIDEIVAARGVFPAALDVGKTGTLTHYDIWSGNVMVDTGVDPVKVTGFIDIPGFFADYAREISFMLMFGVADDAFFARYADTHEFDAGFHDRINMYNLKMQLKHITMYPHESYYREGALRCLKHLQANLG